MSEAAAYTTNGFGTIRTPNLSVFESRTGRAAEPVAAAMVAKLNNYDALRAACQQDTPAHPGTDY